MADQDRLAGRSTLDDTVKLDNSTSPRAGDAVPAETVDWLLAGDPAIRWQTMRDLLDSPPAEVENERARVAVAGWGRRLLERQDPDGTWAGGLYSPKWTSTTYTLLLLMRCGLQTGHPAALRGIERLWDGARYFDGGLTPPSPSTPPRPASPPCTSAWPAPSASTIHELTRPSIGCWPTNSTTAVGTARPCVSETATVHSTPRSPLLKPWSMHLGSNRNGPTSPQRLFGAESSSSPIASTSPTAPARSCTLSSPVCHSRPAGATTSSAASTTSPPQRPPGTNATPTPSRSLVNAGAKMAPGRCRTNTLARPGSTWRGPAGPAAGTRCEPTEFCAGLAHER